jgi:ribulose-bisphosphate carboxylase small chain
VPDRTPKNNKFFETFSFLPPLSNDEISKQVAYIVNNGWTPCLEFAEPEQAYVSSENTVRFGGSASVLYFDNRYWTMWKLPMFGCTDGAQVVKEMQACTKAFPDAYIRLVAFDNVKQVQCAMLLVHRPASATEAQPLEKRSVA